jgi:hypothetical protein
MSLPVDEAEVPPKLARMMQLPSLPSDCDDDMYGDLDHISKLPNEIKGSILFRLPLKEAGRTTTLSKC